jgi:hypothetical protein
MSARGRYLVQHFRNSNHIALIVGCGQNRMARRCDDARRPRDFAPTRFDQAARPNRAGKGAHRPRVLDEESLLIKDRLTNLN